MSFGLRRFLGAPPPDPRWPPAGITWHVTMASASCWGLRPQTPVWPTAGIEKIKCFKKSMKISLPLDFHGFFETFDFFKGFQLDKIVKGGRALDGGGYVFWVLELYMGGVTPHPG